MGDGVLESQITRTATELQYQSYDPTTGRYKKMPTFSLARFTRRLSLDEKFRFFMGDGMDYKGQANTGFETVGKGVGGSFEVDLAQIFLPGTPLTAAVEAKMKVRKADHRFISIMYLPDDLVNTKADGSRAGKNKKPISFYDMNGKLFEIEVGLEASVGFDASKTGLGVFDAAEAVGLSLEAKATAKVGGGYKYQCIQAHATRLDYFSKGEIPQLKKEFFDALQDKRSSAMYRHDESFLFGGRYKASWVNPFASITLGQHEGEAGASAGVEVSAKYKPPVMPDGTSIASVEAKAEAGIKGSLKRRTYRLQTIGHNRLIVTQDISVDFKRVVGEIGVGLGLKVGLSAEWESSDEASGAEAEAFEKQLLELEAKKENAFIDSIGYHGGVAVWAKDEPWKLMPGSGLVRGHSVVLKNLVAYMKDPSKGQGYIATLAKALRVKKGQLIEALTADPILFATLSDVVATKPDAAVYIEACFAACLGGQPTRVAAMEVAARKDGVTEERAEKTGARRFFSRKSTYHNKKYGVLPEFIPLIEKALEDKDETTGAPALAQLECIRFRFYEDNTSNNDATKFKVGIKFLSLFKASFELEKVERAGTQAAWELYRRWFGPMAEYNPPTTSPKVFHYFDEAGRVAYMDATDKLMDIEHTATQDWLMEASLKTPTTDKSRKSWRHVYAYLKTKDEGIAEAYHRAMTRAFAKMNEEWEKHQKSAVPEKSVILPTLLF